MTRAIEKARRVKPFVRVLGWRQYEVANRATGATYRVEFDVREGQRLASCSCAAGQAGRFICYHVAACAGAHVCIAADRAGAPVQCAA
jgi:uncharacterized Zn finger protein